MFATIIISLCLQWVTASNYFHDISRISLKPDPSKDHASFGFSLGYQNGLSSSIVTGAPHSNSVGKVFRCPIENLFVNNNYCEDIDIDVATLAPYNTEPYPDLKLNLGASIAAAPDYFLTCAPLWPSQTEILEYFSYGTCFTYNGTAHRYRGMLEKFIKNPRTVQPSDIINGGTGWKTLIDEDNDLVLLAKVVLHGDIVSVDASNPLAQVNSLVATSSDQSRIANNAYLKRYSYLGYSMTSGKFFESTKTVYAVSATTRSVTGTILFLSVSYSRNTGLKKLSLIVRGTTDAHDYAKIEDDTFGSMFGAALTSADLNGDALSDLLVGAPVQGDGEEGYENGAIHIYLGGDLKTIDDDSRHREIIGSEEGSRFGTAIASSDVDGDNIPEIFVSAPYVDSGVGALYILSGYELHKTLISHDSYKKISLSQLKLTQKIYHKEFRTFGYSLMSIPDVNDNGCNELAVGSPGSDEIVLLRCIPAVKVNISAELVGKPFVREQDSNFTVKICITAEHLTRRNTTLELIINAEVIGDGASIDGHRWSVTWDVYGPDPVIDCRDVVVHLESIDSESVQYRFSTELQMDEDIIMNNKDFNRTWVMLSSQSVKKASIEVSRHCSGKDCDPNLSVDFEWDGSATSKNYTLGSSDSLTTRLLVKNSGHRANEACMMVTTRGAPVAKTGCVAQGERYKCFLTKLGRNAEREISIEFNMSHPNLDSELRVQATLYDVCSQSNKGSHVKQLIIPYHFDAGQIRLRGSSHNQTISDVEIQDQTTNVINDAQDYTVENNGPVMLKNISASIAVDKKPFITSYRVSHEKCTLPESSAHSMIFRCYFDLPPGSTAKFIVSSVISKDKIMDSLVDKKLEVTSTFILSISEKYDQKKIRLATVFTWQKERFLGQNKNLIVFLAILGAVIALAVVIFVLHKMEFFKRKEKTKLDIMKKDHQLRMSVKRPMSASSEMERSDYDNECLDMQIEEDSPFETVGIPNPVMEQENKA